MKNNLNRQLSKVDSISKNLKERIENASEDKEIVINELLTGYKDLFGIRSFTHSTSKKKWKVENCTKLETFKAPCLNIKLPKLKGYDSAMNILTFQLTFEKPYEKRIPRTM